MKQHKIKKGEIFVFGSNLAGIHGAGAALTALKKYGAKSGKCWGFYGNSYALPTKGNSLKRLDLEQIETYAYVFILFAQENPDKKFFLTRVGCGLAGYTDEQIAPFFKDAPSNVRKPPGW